jgi:hypothetical protein
MSWPSPGPLHMPLEAERRRHLPVAIPKGLGALLAKANGAPQPTSYQTAHVSSPGVTTGAWLEGHQFDLADLARVEPRVGLRQWAAS